MRIALGGLALESVTFLPQETTVDEFRMHERNGDRILQEMRDSNTIPGGFISVCEQEGFDMVGLIHTNAFARGPATDDAFEHYTAALCDGLAALKGSIDGVLLELHGALASATRPSADTDVLRRIRDVVGLDLPVMIALDYHGNIDPELIRLATATFGYHFSPHTDMAETGQRAARCLVKTLRGEITPTCAIARPGVIIPSIFSATSLEPLGAIVSESVSVRSEDPYTDVTIFGGFAYADSPFTGMSVVAVTDAEPARAQRLVHHFSNEIRDVREQLYSPFRVYTVDEALDRVTGGDHSSSKPVVLLEHADRMHDSTYLLRAVVERNLPFTVAVPYIWDPKAASVAAAAGVGNSVTLDIGSHSSERAGRPVRVTGIVRWAGGLQYRISGPYQRGRLLDLGDCALIEADNVSISVISDSFPATDLDCFTNFGLGIGDFDAVVLRSKTHFRAVYEDAASEILVVDTPDWGPADIRTLPYEHVDRTSTYPLNVNETAHPSPLR